MNKVRKKFILYAMISIFVLLTVLLGVISVINFTMAAEDADRLTDMLSANRGMFAGESAASGMQSGNRELARMGPMGPDSPEMAKSLRYFTYAFDGDGKAIKIAHEISAVSEQEAADWAAGLKNGSTGWTRFTYRYRVYTSPRDGLTYVTVIDQGRELISPFRILRISIIGEAVVLIIAFIFLRAISKKLFRPLEEADRKQKLFIREIEKDFKVPLTVMSADTELIERGYGATDSTRSLRRQINSMTGLVKQLGSLSIIPADGEKREFDLSAVCSRAIEEYADRFAQKGVTFSSTIAPGLKQSGDEDSAVRALDELLCNALKFAGTYVRLILEESGGHARLYTENDTDLPDGEYDQIFDRFTRLENADGVDGAGLGLAHVKETAEAQNGRVSARAADGRFTVTAVF